VPRFLAPAALATAIAAVGVAAAASVEDDPPPEPKRASDRVIVGLPYPELRRAREIVPPVERADAVLGVYPALRAPVSFAFPAPRAVAAARRWAAGRQGEVSFAVLGDRGGLSGSAMRRQYESASLVKAMILVAYLRRLADERREPSDLELARLDAMIRVSDNFSASDLYEQVGPDGLEEVARLARMKDFGSSAFWGNSLVTAADQVRLFLSLDRLLPRAWRSYARGLLENVMPAHAWGIPAAARPDWRVMFKGGWRPDDEDGQIVHQAALLERGERRLAIAVMTESDPGEVYGQETVRGIALRLLRPVGQPRPRPGLLSSLPGLVDYRAPPPKALQ
jgi:hypothetical protein